MASKVRKRVNAWTRQRFKMLRAHQKRTPTAEAQERFNELATKALRGDQAALDLILSGKA